MPTVTEKTVDALTSCTDAERVRDLQLADARRDAELANMRATMERQQALIERLVAEKAPPKRRPEAE
jgi:anti-sigma factor RsiW